MFLAAAAGCVREEGASGSAPRHGEPLRLVDRTAECGIDFTAVCGGRAKDYIVEVNGGGVALFDADGDGDLDVFLVNGARFPDDDPAAAEGPAPSDRLYLNQGDWSFTDATESAGLRESAWGCGCAVADVENDGDIDLFVTNLGADELWLNRGDGTFESAGERAGLADASWGASCAFLDYDRDGLVDLFVSNYLEFDRSKVKSRTEGGCRYKGQTILCGPVGLPEGTCRLYRNLGEGRFEDVSEPAGITSRTGYCLGVAVGDPDGDGWPDVYVAADTTENLLFRNRGDGTFEEIGLAAGVARNDLAVAQAGMGVEFAFVGSATREDIFVVNYEDDTNTFYRNEGDGFFSEATSVKGLGGPCFKYLGWASFFADFDLDADLDLFIAQGHVVPQADAIASSPGYRQPNKLFLQDAEGVFRDASEGAGPALEVEKSSRGAAYGDLDGDGDLDLVVNDIDARCTVIESEGPPRGHWIAARLEGRRSNRAGIDAVVRVRAGGHTQARRVRSAIGYASACELAVRFGLGRAESVEELRVSWPSGRVETFPVPGVDRLLRLVEGKGTAVRAAAAGEAGEPPRG